MSAPEKWGQLLVVFGGRSQRRLAAHMNLGSHDPANPLVIRGAGEYFPEIEGADWFAGCMPYVDSMDGLSDLRLVLECLVDGSFILMTDAPDQFQSYLRGAA